MWEQEREHVNKFKELLPKYKVRPTALLPLWNVAGFVLGKYYKSSYFCLIHRRRVLPAAISNVLEKCNLENIS